MRKNLSFILTITLALTCFCTVIKAEDFDGGFETDTAWSSGSLDSTVFHIGKSSLKIKSGQRGEGLIELDPNSMALDPSILKICDLWHLFCGGPNQQNCYATSSDGKFFNHDKLMKFEKDGVPNIMANGIATSDGY